MSDPGESDLAQPREALLDALEALDEHRASIVIVGAQAIYLHTGPVLSLALPELTFDGDIAIDPRGLTNDPVLEEAMDRAGFELQENPGEWRKGSVLVDLMVPDLLSGPGGKRGARIPPHSRRSARRARGLEAAMVDCSQMTISSLRTSDARSFSIRVAGPAALLVAKLHKLAERLNEFRNVDNKDAHDIYRLLSAIPTDVLATRLRSLSEDPLAGAVTFEALRMLEDLFVLGSPPVGAKMAGEAEALVGEPAIVEGSVIELARDLIEALSGDAPR